MLQYQHRLGFGLFIFRNVVCQRALGLDKGDYSCWIQRLCALNEGPSSVSLAARYYARASTHNKLPRHRLPDVLELKQYGVIRAYQKNKINPLQVLQHMFKVCELKSLVTQMIE